MTFEPNRMGMLEATLTATSKEAGTYIFPLQGYAKLPYPEGPFIVPRTGSISLKVKNVFSVPTEFYLRVSVLTLF